MACKVPTKTKIELKEQANSCFFPKPVPNTRYNTIYNVNPIMVRGDEIRVFAFTEMFWVQTTVSSM